MSPEERFWSAVIVAVLFGGTFVVLIYRKLAARGGKYWDEGIIPKNVTQYIGLKI